MRRLRGIRPAAEERAENHRACVYGRAAGEVAKRFLRRCGKVGGPAAQKRFENVRRDAFFDCHCKLVCSERRRRRCVQRTLDLVDPAANKLPQHSCGSVTSVKSGKVVLT